MYKEICEQCSGQGMIKKEGKSFMCPCVIGIRIGDEEEDDDEDDEDNSLYGRVLVRA